jgi:hypothetical protein
MSALICGSECYGMSAISVGSVRLDVGELHHLGPFLGFVDDESAEVGGRTRKRCASQVGKPGLHLGIGESAIDLRVELVDDVRAAAPAARCSNLRRGSLMAYLPSDTKPIPIPCL